MKPYRLGLLLLLTSAVVAGVGTAPDVQAQRATSGRRVVLISLDGFAARNLDDPRLPLPNLRRLAAEGVRADAMEVSTPSVTWPNHTTMVTGVSPALHGVLANGAIEPSTGDRPYVINPRRSKEELCRVPTLYDVAHAAGLQTAEVNWPVTRGAPTLNWSFPDHPEPVRYATPNLRQEMQTAGLFADPTDANWSALGSLMQDHLRTQTAALLLKRHKPDLLLLHLLHTDGVQHAVGPDNDTARAALALADRHVGDILQALREAGTLSGTAVLVAADHGFIQTTREIRPNVRLRAKGLIHPVGGAIAADAPLEWDAQALSEGGVALVYVPRGRARPDLITATATALEGIDGVEAVLKPEQYAAALGLALPARLPQAPDFVLTAKDGYAFGNAVTGEETVALPKPGGTHGYPGKNPKMDALFVGAGAGLRKGVRVQRIRNVDVAPTAAALLGVTLTNTEGQPLSSFLQ
jgi:predicted AlkP superfamily pyrophosphatase or phosphodiesterase